MERALGRPKTFNTSEDAAVIAQHLAFGLKRKQIIALTGFTSWQYKTARLHLASCSTQETSKTSENAPEAAEIEPKTAKAEKPKPGPPH